MRKAAAERTRRVIFNNDGDDGMFGVTKGTIDRFLQVRTEPLAGSAVDTLFYCTTESINWYTHHSAFAEIFPSKVADNPDRMDPLALVIDWCRRNGKEVFWTLRMNDWHDNFFPELLSQWKKDHRDLLFAREEEAGKYPMSDPRHIWTPADFAHEEVRKLTVRTVAEVVDRYDVDGIDLDFLRARWYFKESRLGQPVTQEHMDMLTAMVGKIRQEVRAAGERKGKPILLSARVSPTAELSRHVGTDVERWLSEGYLDLLVVGGHGDPFLTAGKDLIDRGHASGIPVYVCISGSDVLKRGIEGSDLAGDNVEAWRGAAANAWRAGADGIVTFNLFPHKDRAPTKVARTVWSDISDPGTLAGKDKLFCIENLGYTRTLCFLMGQYPWDVDVLPIEIEKGSTVERILMVGDDIPARKDHVRSLRLRIRLDGLQDEDRIVVKMNGARVDASREDPQWLAGDVSAKAMKVGRNVLSVTFTDGAGERVTMTAVELTVRYRGQDS